jgi:SnoaL-like polyketide cyclase
MKYDNLPFALPERPQVTRIRQRNTAELRVSTGVRTQPLAGFEDDFTDIVDYILRITEQIWTDRAVGRIYDTYDANCTIYTSTGVVRSVEEVIASTTMGINAGPDGETHHLNIAWSGDEAEGFYTSHLGFARSTNLGATPYGPATGRRLGRFFVADCITLQNRIHTEWLVRDNGVAVRQMGFDIHETAQRLAELPVTQTTIVAPPTRLQGQAGRNPYDGPVTTIEGWVANHFSRIWNFRFFDHISSAYCENVIAHWAGGRVACGQRNLSSLVIGLLASVPDATLRVEHVSWSDETDGVIVAVRWTLEGTSQAGGLLGPIPSGRPISIMGMTHLRFNGPVVVEEWTMFDEVAIVTQAFRI